MIPSFTSLMSTVAGKVAIGLVVASTSVGAAAAAGAEIPFVAPADEPVAETVEEPAPEPPAEEPAVEEEPSEEPAVEDDVQVEELTLDAAEPATEDDADESEDEANHGEVVSSFVHETDLEGCEKGQATSAVARGLVDPSSETFEDDLAAYLDGLDKCTDDESDADVEEADESDAEDGGGHGKPDHAGSRGAERSNGKAKGHGK